MSSTTDSSTRTFIRGSIVLVGPDGSGKSTIAELVTSELEAEGVVVTRAHWNPGVLIARDRRGTPVEEPHAAPPRGLALSTAKLLLTFADFAIGSATTWRRARRGGVLLVERGWYDQVVDPLRYRLDPRLRVIALTLGSLLPAADVVGVLSGSSAAIATRKPELGVGEIARQTALWRRIADQAGQFALFVDTTSAAPEVGARQILSTYGSDRWVRVPAPRRLDLHVAAGPSTKGALSIYRPSRTRARIVARAAATMVRAGLAQAARPPIPRLDDLWRYLGIRPDTVSSMRSPRPGRWVLGAARDGRLTHVIKVGPAGDARLATEAASLTRLARAHFVAVPVLEWFGHWEDRTVVVTAAVQPSRKATIGVEEVAGIATSLTRGDAGEPMVHGDFASWNFLQSSRLFLLDWEAAQLIRKPLFDLAHFVVQDGALLRRWTPEEAAQLLAAPGSPGWRHLEAVGVEPSDAGSLVRAYLDETLVGRTPHRAFGVALSERLR